MQMRWQWKSDWKEWLKSTQQQGELPNLESHIAETKHTQPRKVSFLAAYHWIPSFPTLTMDKVLHNSNYK